MRRICTSLRTKGDGAGRIAGKGARALIACVLVVLLLLASTAEAQNPAGRIYVRRIEFEGVTGISDEVLRREMLQLEGTYLNTVALDQSLRRLSSLPYVESARAALRPVPGAPDMVDVIVTVSQAPARRYGGGGGYSPSELASLHGYFVNENLFGTGRRFSVTLEGGPLGSTGAVVLTNPYVRPAAVSRTLRFSSRKMNRPAANASTLDASIASAGVEYVYPTGRPAAPPAGSSQTPLPAPPLLGETNQALRFGLRAADVQIKAVGVTSRQLADWIIHNGNPNIGLDALSTSFNELVPNMAWRYDTRDRTPFTTSGLEQTLSLNVAAPGGDVQYFVFDYTASSHRQLGERWTASLRGRIGYGTAYGSKTTSLPPYLNFFAGGPGTVRGYRADFLGPLDSLGQPYGGNLLLAANFDLTTPWPDKWRDRVRVGFFVDVGNVFSTEGVVFRNAAGQPLDYSFDPSQLRLSAGVAVRVLIPLGEVQLSYGVPLNADVSGTGPYPPDQVDRFQIAFGVDY